MTRQTQDDQTDACKTKRHEAKLTLDLLSVLNFCHVSSNLFLDTGPSILPCRNNEQAYMRCHAGNALTNGLMSATEMLQQILHVEDVLDFIALLQACMHSPTLSSYIHSFLDSLSASLDLSLVPFWSALC